MPKAHDHRHHRSLSHRRYRRRFAFTYLGVFVIIAGLVVAWWLNTAAANVSIALNLNQPQAYNVAGQPSLDAQFINRVLVHYHSPAAGKGQALYNDGVKYGIDPAYALAFFMHESTFGTRGVAVVTHSLGNIRVTQGYPGYEGYRAYPTWEAGFEDWYKLISQQYISQWNLTTVDQIIPVYAPSSDNNDVAAYIQSIKNAVDTWHNGTVDVG